MDPIGYYLFAREAPFGEAARDVPVAAAATKKQTDAPVVPTLSPSADLDAATCTASTIAGILQGHYNANGSRRNNYDNTQAASLPVSGQLDQLNYSGSIVAGVSSRVARAETVLSSSSGHHVMSSNIMTTSAPQVDKLSILRSMMKSNVSSSLITSRLHGGFIPAKKQAVDMPTLSLSSKHKHETTMSEVVEAPGLAASFPWDTHLTSKSSLKAVLVKGPATMSKDKLVKLNVKAKPNAKDAKKSKTAWSPDEDEIFLTAVKIHGSNWSEVAKLISAKTVKRVKHHAGIYGKARAALVEPTPPLTASEYFAKSDIGNVKKLFPSATAEGLKYMVDSKWSTLKPKKKERYTKIAKKDLDRYNWEMQVFSALKEHQRDIGSVIKDMLAEIRSVFPNISKEGEQRLLNERTRHLKRRGS